jgi:hypothetical protein
MDGRDKKEKAFAISGCKTFKNVPVTQVLGGKEFIWVRPLRRKNLYPQYRPK